MQKFFTRIRRLSACIAIPIAGFTLAQAEQSLTLQVDESTGRLSLIGESGPSLLNGYSPAQFTIKREQADYYRARRMGEPLHEFRLIVGVSLEEPERKYWAETDLSNVWDEEILNAEGTKLLLGWWLNGRWEGVVPFELEHNSAFAAASMLLRPDQINGRPHIFVFKDGEFIPPEKYAASVAGSTVELIHNASLTDVVPVPPAGIGIEDSVGLTWVHYAASWGMQEWIESWPGSEDSVYSDAAIKNLNPMVLAAMKGHASCLPILLKKGFSHHRKDDLGLDAGHMAIIYGHYDAMKALIDGGYFVDRRSSNNSQPIALAYKFGHGDILGLLLDNGADFRNFERSNAQAALFTACMKGDLPTAKFLLSKRARVKKLTESGWSPITLAVRSGNIELVELLLEEGANPNDRAPAADKLSLVMYAVQTGDTELLRLLADHGASFDELTPHGLGLVELATLIGNGDVVAELFAAGATCSLQPQMAAEILITAISNDIREMAILAFAECVSPNFAFYDKFPMDWVIDYYNAQSTGDWWQQSSYERTDRDQWPQFTHPSDLDQPLRPIAAPAPDYPKELHERYGRIETKVGVVIHSSGQVLFPKFEGDLPHALRLGIHAALSEWRFAPPTHNGNPAILHARIPFILDIEEEKADELSSDMTPPVPTRQAPPIFPWDFAQSKFEGFTHVRFIVTKSGTTRDIHITRTTHPLFSNASENALASWRFDPATKNGEPVNSYARILIPYYSPRR